MTGDPLVATDYAFARGVDVPPFYAGEVAKEAGRLEEAGREIVPMHFGQPSRGPPRAVLEAAERGLASAYLGYWESEQLRARIARHYLETYHVEVAPERVLLTSGASAGLVALFTAIFNTDDRIALARPGYPAYRNAIRALGRIAVEIESGPETGFRMNAQMIDAIRPGIHGLVVASPANPTGAIIGRGEFRAIAEICRARGVRLISDEVYHGISYGVETVSALEVDAEAIVVNSFSKLYRMAGWRLGWVVVPDHCVARVQSHLTNLFLTPPALSQHAALAAFDSPRDLEEAVAMYARNRQILLAALPEIGFRNISTPDGAFYLYADVSNFTDDSVSFSRQLLLELGVAITPGIDFDQTNGRRYVRFSFAGSTRQIERGVELLRSSDPRHWRRS